MIKTAGNLDQFCFYVYKGSYKKELKHLNSYPFLTNGKISTLENPAWLHEKKNPTR